MEVAAERGDGEVKAFRRSGARERRAVDAYIFCALLPKAGSYSAYLLAPAGPKASRCKGLEISLISLRLHPQDDLSLQQTSGSRAPPLDASTA